MALTAAVVACVAVLAAGAVDRLLDGVGCKHREDDRNAGVDGSGGDAFGDLARYVVVVVGLSLDDGA